MAFLVILLSLWSPHCPRRPHVIPIVPTSSPCCPCCPHIVPIAPRRSPCGPHGCGLCCLHPMLSLWFPWSPHHSIVPMSSPHHLEGSYIISNPQIPTAPIPDPPGGWGPQISKNAIRFELIDILILFEDLKSVETTPPMGGCMGWWVGGCMGWWVGGCMGGLMGGTRSNHEKSNKSGPNRDNSILFEDL